MNPSFKLFTPNAPFFLLRLHGGPRRANNQYFNWSIGSWSLVTIHHQRIVFEPARFHKLYRQMPANPLNTYICSILSLSAWFRSPLFGWAPDFASRARVSSYFWCTPLVVCLEMFEHCCSFWSLGSKNHVGRILPSPGHLKGKSVWFIVHFHPRRTKLNKSHRHLAHFCCSISCQFLHVPKQEYID